MHIAPHRICGYDVPLHSRDASAVKCHPFALNFAKPEGATQPTLAYVIMRMVACEYSPAAATSYRNHILE